MPNVSSAARNGGSVKMPLVVSQTWYIERIKGDLTLKASIKNLTDSTRGIVYDTDQTNDEISRILTPEQRAKFEKLKFHFGARSGSRGARRESHK